MSEGSNPHLWQKAASLAARFHTGQVRKDGRTPYIAHPFRVAMVVSQLFGVNDSTILAAALLHDVIEDTPADYDNVFHACGKDVADIVVTLTKDMRLPDVEREKAYDEQIENSDWRTKLIKLADVYDNLCDVGPGSNQQRRAIDKALRAIAIAENDGNPHLLSPIAQLKDLIDEIQHPTTSTASNGKSGR